MTTIIAILILESILALALALALSLLHFFHFFRLYTQNSALSKETLPALNLKSMTINFPSIALKGRQYVSPGRSFALRSEGLGRNPLLTKSTVAPTKTRTATALRATLLNNQVNPKLLAIAIAIALHGATFFFYSRIQTQFLTQLKIYDR